MKIAILNTPIITTHGSYLYEPCDREAAVALLQTEEFESFVGHDATASCLSLLAGVDVPCRRVPLTQEPGQRALVARPQFQGRVPEGKVFTVDEVQSLGFEFGILTRTS